MSQKRILTTALEDWVTDHYLRLKITRPEHIDIKYIARRNEIFLSKKELPAFHEVIGKFKNITIDKREPLDVQKEQFFHELCHILRHFGIQSMMPEAFRELQERDSRHFTKYAAIPYHMLKFIDLEDSYVIEQMVSLFKVSPELCIERLLQIKKRLELFTQATNQPYDVHFL